MADLWHYARTDLAERILGLFEINLSSALVFFAPRRMGKTEFLIKDITPIAEKMGWKVFYFSFLEINEDAEIKFINALAGFAEQIGVLAKANKLLKKISKISGEAGGIKAEVELNKTVSSTHNMREIAQQLAKKEKILLLLDEVQILAKDAANDSFIASLRTALDIHKDNIKVIFTGSSRGGLRQMFAQSKAPFFHFGQNLPFPELDRDFIDHLASVFKIITGRTLDADKLWDIFQKTQKIPQISRTLVERLILHPDLKLETAYQELLAEISDDREFVAIWKKCSALEQLLLKSIAFGNTLLFGEETRDQMAKQLGLETLSTSSIQNRLLSLQSQELIGRSPERGTYFIDDPNFKSWLKTHD